ncbi:MAG: tRNA 4-thiouridine(8) synthase ThiI [Gemmatimonadota bacterium]|uniref:tRNA uracil 4-sulfurtransferase ThiI n=1 Tax=Candidatus Palauibacter scopulicola TaxID=3056741 RepID=UPI00238E22DF|nr:tRNA uracil 4-sulfurtransferase ThiI [Candidatus Palauibacter scopulicola]MDE2663929.1 tRNA 4-thiouridine(8) synthase ThiI [Candidatus Palauibacter scopulicola]
MAAQHELGAGPVRALVRFSGELSTKARRTRSRFQNRLAANLRDAFDAEGVDAALESGWSRFHVESPDADFLDPLLRTFGVSSCSVLAGECEADLDTIVATGTALFAESVRGRSYAVRARRSGSHGFSSSDIQQRLGASLNPGATVDLGNPDITVFVEVRDERVFFHEDRIRGPSGLPLGVQGHALALISGGFDSAVAAWMALRRGIRLDYVFCNLGGSAYERMVVEVTKILADRWSYGTRPRLHVLEFGPVVEAMRARAKPAYLQVVLKRMMYRAAATIGERIGVEAIVTGESVGQVSSQTLRNLRAIENASSLPVLRPLLGFHKEEILDRAREIGTYDLSSRVREYCDLVPQRPVTASSPEAAEAQESAVGFAELDEAVAGAAVHDVRALRPESMVGASLYVADVPDGARVLDTRSRDAFEAWHWPGAIPRDLPQLERDFGELDRDATYVLCCAEGVRTAYLAEVMQRAGYEAYSFLGGAPRMRRVARGRPGID